MKKTSLNSNTLSIAIDYMHLASGPLSTKPLSHRSLKTYYPYKGFSKFHLDDFSKAGFRATSTSSFSAKTVKSMALCVCV